MLMPEHAALLMDGGGGARILALSLTLSLTLTLTLPLTLTLSLPLTRSAEMLERLSAYEVKGEGGVPASLYASDITFG